MLTIQTNLLTQVTYAIPINITFGDRNVFVLLVATFNDMLINNSGIFNF